MSSGSFESELNVMLFVLGRSSVDRYVRALAVCNSLAELASHGSEVEFCQRITTLMSLKKCWTDGHADVKVVHGSSKAEDESVAEAVSAVEIENIDLQSIIHDRLPNSQRVLVLCSKNRTSDGTSENSHQQTEHYRLFPSLLTVPSAQPSKFCIMY